VTVGAFVAAPACAANVPAQPRTATIASSPHGLFAALISVAVVVESASSSASLLARYLNKHALHPFDAHVARRS
jgi:hypothetical protein